jgi:hypothetical protein
LAIVTPFTAFFAWSTFHELRRRRREGPPDDPRDAFEFDEDAPSYEEPVSAETTAQDDDEAQDTPTAAEPDGTGPQHEDRT